MLQETFVTESEFRRIREHCALARANEICLIATRAPLTRRWLKAIRRHDIAVYFQGRKNRFM